MPSLRSSVRVTRSRFKSDMRTPKKKLIRLFDSSSLEKKRSNRKEILQNTKKILSEDAVIPSLHTSRSILSNSLSSLSNSSGSPELDTHHLVLRKKSIQLVSTAKSVLNNSISSRQNNQQNGAQGFSNQNNWQTPELKMVKNTHQSLSKLKNKAGGTSHPSSENFIALKMSVLTEMGYKPDQFLNHGQFNRNIHNKWLQFGQFFRFKPLYESAYLEPFISAPIIYVCEFCLTHVLTLDQFKTHMKSCPINFPPGNEIYRDVDEGLCIWEVEGGLETTYCRNLCLMAKLFMSSKTLYHEVDTFTFYILTEISSRGYVTVGYFSKEKNPSKNNNLSCLLTLPHAQGKGYGKLLIDLKHPLSDMGLLAYRSYWRSVLFSVLRQLKNAQTVSIKDLSIETAIHSSDILSTLLINDMLRSRHDSFYIDIDKALNSSLDSLCRRSICVDFLKWLPPFEPIPQFKMNSYVSN